MKKTIRVILSVIMVVAMMASVSVCAFADGNSFTFTGNGDVTFKFGGKTVSMAQQLGVKEFDPYGLRGICQSFVEMADNIPLDYTAKLAPNSAEFTINDADFICAFIVENASGSNGYVKVCVLANSDEAIDNAKLYIFKGDKAVGVDDLPNADAILSLALQNGCTIVTLTKDYIPFLDDAAGFTICAGFQKKDGTWVLSWGQHDNHNGNNGNNGNGGNGGDGGNGGNGGDKTTGDGVLIPWKFWNYGKNNDHKVDLNVGAATFEFGNKGFDVKLDPNNVVIDGSTIGHPDLSVDAAHPEVGSFTVDINDVLTWMVNTFG